MPVYTGFWPEVGRIFLPPCSRRAKCHAKSGTRSWVVERFGERQVLEPLERVEHDLPRLFDELAAEAGAAVRSAGVSADRVQVRRRLLHLRLTGQEATVEVDWSAGMPVREAFAARYERLFGHRPEGRPVELESMRVVVSSTPETDSRQTPAPGSFTASPAKRRRAWLDGRWQRLPAYDRESLKPGAAFEGPALVFERRSALLVASGWRARVDGAGAVLLELEESGAATDETTQPEAVRLELFARRFASLVEEMGERLERTAVSTNVKERLDFSCALLNPAGRLGRGHP